VGKTAEMWPFVKREKMGNRSHSADGDEEGFPRYLADEKASVLSVKVFLEALTGEFMS